MRLHSKLRILALGILLLLIVMVGWYLIYSGKGKNQPYLVILSLDGFRYDFQNLTHTPTLDSIQKYGTKAVAFIPCFPTKTFPNHYSMATGLHPDNHGIVDNRFWDSTLGMYSIGRRNAVENPAFYGGEPFWVTAENQGIKTATFYWVGSEAPIGGRYPTYWKIYSDEVSFEARIDTTIYWLSLPEEKRPQIITLYYPEPDKTIHRHGATHDSVLLLISKLDSLTGVLLGRLNDLPIASQINFILVSDHGMTDITPDNYINLNNYIDTSLVALVTGGTPVLHISAIKGSEDSLLQQLQKIPNLTAWRRTQMPERFHFGKNPRILPIVVIADPGYNLGFEAKANNYRGATHGYDNQFHEMWGIFYAIGPAFKKNYLHPPMLNLNLYNIVIRTFKLKPAPNDGRVDDIEPIFHINK